MKDRLYIQSRMDDVLTQLPPQSEHEKLKRDAMSETWIWCFNFGNLRTESEINNRIQNCKDELTAFEFIGEKRPSKLKPVEEKIKILEDVLRD